MNHHVHNLHTLCLLRIFWNKWYMECACHCIIVVIIIVGKTLWCFVFQFMLFVLCFTALFLYPVLLCWCFAFVCPLGGSRSLRSKVQIWMFIIVKGLDRNKWVLQNLFLINMHNHLHPYCIYKHYYSLYKVHFQNVAMKQWNMNLH